MEIRKLMADESKAALQLSWKVFQEYEAPEYSEQGVDSFYNILQDTEYVNQLTMYGCFDDEKLVGVLATRSSGSHIALFFVDGSYHKRGIGKNLFRLACADNHSGHMTVNSSPYAVDVYHRLGFSDLDGEQISDGIRFTPMEYCHL